MLYTGWKYFTTFYWKHDLTCYYVWQGTWGISEFSGESRIWRGFFQTFKLGRESSCFYEGCGWRHTAPHSPNQRRMVIHTIPPDCIRTRNDKCTTGVKPHQHSGAGRGLRIRAIHPTLFSLALMKLVPPLINPLLLAPPATYAPIEERLTWINLTTVVQPLLT